jgi:hypothetical protein
MSTNVPPSFHTLWSIVRFPIGTFRKAAQNRNEIVEYQNKQPSRALYYLSTATKYLAELKDVMASQGSEGIDAWVKSKKANQINRIKVSLLYALCIHFAIENLPDADEIYSSIF